MGFATPRPRESIVPARPSARSRNSLRAPTNSLPRRVVRFTIHTEYLLDILRAHSVEPEIDDFLARRNHSAAAQSLCGQYCAPTLCRYRQRCRIRLSGGSVRALQKPRSMSTWSITMSTVTNATLRQGLANYLLYKLASNENATLASCNGSLTNQLPPTLVRLMMSRLATMLCQANSGTACQRPSIQQAKAMTWQAASDPSILPIWSTPGVRQPLRRRRHNKTSATKSAITAMLRRSMDTYPHSSR